MAKTAPEKGNFLVDFATLAREIAQDIFPVDEVVALHRLSDEEWAKIQKNQKFQQILHDMQVDWNSASNTRERIRVKAQTGLESQLEIFIADISDMNIPLAQRVEAGKFLARLGELDNGERSGAGDGKVVINIVTNAAKPPVTIDAKAIPPRQIEMDVS